MCHCIVFRINPRVNVYLKHRAFNFIARQCGETFDGGECWCCTTRRIQMEELFHAENIWYNTGRQNVYTVLEPFYSQDMQQGFRMGLITQRLDESEWYSAERATVQCFLGCSEHNNRSLWCRKNVLSTFTSCNEKATSKYAILAWETDHWCRPTWVFHLGVSCRWSN